MTARVLPPLAISIFALSLVAALGAAAAAGTLSCDYLAYDSAIRRFLAGGTLYIGPFDPTGPCGYFYYPPPFVLAVLPLTLLPDDVAAVVAAGVLTLAFLSGVAMLPVAARTKWLLILLGGLSWPLIYAIKLGQVGPVLFLLFAAAWRWTERPVRLGVAMALGTAVKVQPLLLFVWAFVTGRRRATYVAFAVFAALAFVATVVTGPGAWVDEVNLLMGRSRPVATEGLVTIGRLAVDAGLGEVGGWVLQLAMWAAAAGLTAYALVRGSAAASFQAIVVASQVASPILWNHYALVLLLPVAWLLDRGVWIAALIPLLSTLPLVTVTPPVVYPIEYLATLMLVVWAGVQEAQTEGGGWSLRQEVA